MDMNQMMQQAQQMQLELARAQEEIQSMTYTATAGGGMVEATALGSGSIESLKIDPEAVDPEDVEMLEDMIIAALNEAFRQVDDQKAKMMGQFGGGMGGLGSGLF